MEKTAELSADFYKKWNQLVFDIANSKDSGFHISVLANSRIIMSDSVPVAGTDGLNILINPEVWGSYSPAIREAVITARLWNIIGQHAVRRGERDKDTYATACNYAVNGMLYEAGYKIPASAINKKYFGKTPEEIYDLIYVQQPPPPPSPSGGSGKDGNDPDGSKALMSNGLLEPDDVQQATDGKQSVDAYDSTVEPNLPDEEATGQSWQDMCDDACRNAVTQADMTSNGEMPGMMPANIKLMLDSLFEARINTQELVRKYLTERSNNRFSYQRPRRRFMPEIILPSLMGEELGGIYSVFDVSGSVTDKQIKVFNSESAFIQNVLKPKFHSIISFDTAVRDVFNLEKGDILETLEFTGRGGTNLYPAMEYILKQDKMPKLVIVYSDLYCEQYTPDLPFPVLWLCFDNPNARVTQGELIHINVNDY